MEKIVKKLAGKKGALAENEVKDLLKNYAIKTTTYQIVKNIDDLKKIKIPFPVAIKLCSSKILHKTDIGGVKLDIKDSKELEQVFKKFRKRFPTENLLIEHMEKKGVEIIVGLIQGPTFGLTIMFGTGGIFTELYKDVSFRVVPIESYDAVDMIEEIKGRKLLEGFRNIKANKKLVIDLLLKVSKMGEELINHIDQMDLNPVFVYENDICVVDAKLILK